MKFIINHDEQKIKLEVAMENNSDFFDIIIVNSNKESIGLLNKYEAGILLNAIQQFLEQYRE